MCPQYLSLYWSGFLKEASSRHDVCINASIMFFASAVPFRRCALAQEKAVGLVFQFGRVPATRG
jgi:hypothetical protein